MNKISYYCFVYIRDGKKKEKEDTENLKIDTKDGIIIQSSRNGITYRKEESSSCGPYWMAERKYS